MTLNVLILAAGKGKRMHSNLPKPLHTVGGLSLLDHVIGLARTLGANKIGVVTSPDMPSLGSRDVQTFIQSTPLGTGHAVLSAHDWISGLSGNVLILCGDVPFLKSSTLQELVDKKNRTQSALAILTAEVKQENRYGRVFVTAEDCVDCITEYKELDPEVAQKHTLCNAGIILASCSVLPDLLKQLTNDNETGEYYLTDVIHHGKNKGFKTTYTIASEEEIQGINTQVDLAKAEQTFQKMMRQSAMEKGVKLIAPETVFFSYDTHLEPGTVIEPYVVFGPDVKVSGGALIRSFSHLEGCRIGSETHIGPYARLRPGTELEEKVRVGNFVELKNAKLAEGAKINHLSYCGDAVVGKKTNIGAGTITCNYDGANKHETRIGSECFVGSNTCFIAPVSIKDHALIAAGSIITQDVAEGDLAISRAPQKNLSGKGRAFKEKQLKNKEKK